MNRIKCLLAAILSLVVVGCAPDSSGTKQSVQLLFVGNSLTYVGNLPAVFTAMCQSAGRRCSAEMIAEGGATLNQRVGDGALTMASRIARFNYVVLQERGGDYIALPDRIDDRRQAEAAAKALVEEARRLGMKPVILGTYQGDPRASSMLVSAEAALAATLQTPHVAVSNVYGCGARQNADLRWLDPDGGHPGPDLTLLMATLLYEEIFQVPPSVRAIEVHAPIYGPADGPRATSLASTQPTPPDLLRTVSYDIATVTEVMKLAQAHCK